MSRLITPTLTGEAKTEYAQQAIKAAELARQLHNALHQMKRDTLDFGGNDGAAATAKERLEERMDAVEALEGELLEHAMRVTIGM